MLSDNTTWDGSISPNDVSEWSGQSIVNGRIFLCGTERASKVNLSTENLCDMIVSLIDCRDRFHILGFTSIHQWVVRGNPTVNASESISSSLVCKLVWTNCHISNNHFLSTPTDSNPHTLSACSGCPTWNAVVTQSQRYLEFKTPRYWPTYNWISCIELGSCNLKVVFFHVYYACDSVMRRVRIDAVLAIIFSMLII